MQNIIEKIHKYKISKGAGKDTRYVTAVPDPTKPRGTRQVRTNTLSEMYKFLLDFYGITKERTITFWELFEEWVDYKSIFVGARNRGLSQTTITRYITDMTLHVKGTGLASTPINQINPISLEKALIEIIEQKAPPMSESMFKNILGYVAGMFDYAEMKGYIDKDPVKRIDRTRLLSFCSPKAVKQDCERVLSHEEIIALKAVLEERHKAYPYYMPDYAIELALLTGMRVGEIVALKWSDIDEQNINIDHAEHIIKYPDRRQEIVIGEPKCRKHRKFPLTKEINELLHKIRDLGLDGDFLFTRVTGERYTGHDVACALDRRAMEAGISKTSVHGIRRTVSSVLNTMMPRQSVANLLGHLPTTNEQFYDYDVMGYTGKVVSLSSFVSKLEGREVDEKNTRDAI